MTTTQQLTVVMAVFVTLVAIGSIALQRNDRNHYALPPLPHKKTYGNAVVWFVLGIMTCSTVIALLRRFDVAMEIAAPIGMLFLVGGCIMTMRTVISIMFADSTKNGWAFVALMSVIVLISIAAGGGKVLAQLRDNALHAIGTSSDPVHYPLLIAISVGVMTLVISLLIKDRHRLTTTHSAPASDDPAEIQRIIETSRQSNDSWLR